MFEDKHCNRAHPRGLMHEYSSTVRSILVTAICSSIWKILAPRHRTSDLHEELIMSLYTTGVGKVSEFQTSSITRLSPKNYRMVARSRIV
jgi:hypothetical protein